METSKIYRVSPDLADPNKKEAVIGRSTDPAKRRVLSELDRLMQEERGKRVIDIRNPFHPHLISNVRAGTVEVVHANIESIRAMLDNLLEAMQHVHRKQQGIEQSATSPSDFTENCLVAGFIGSEVSNNMLRLQLEQERARKSAIPGGLIVTRHFSPELDLALLAVRRMYGSDGDHIEHPEEQYHYEGFFPASAW